MRAGTRAGVVEIRLGLLRASQLHFCLSERHPHLIRLVWVPPPAALLAEGVGGAAA